MFLRLVALLSFTGMATDGAVLRFIRIGLGDDLLGFIPNFNYISSGAICFS